MSDRWWRAEWSSRRLAALYTQRSRPVRPGLDVLSVYRDHGVILKSSRADNFNKTPDGAKNYQAVCPGDLVVNRMKAWQGSLGISSLSGLVSPDYEVLEPIAGSLEDRYAHHLLRSKPMVGEYATRSTGIRPSQWRLYWQQLRTVEVPVPPRPEQLAIANYLDRETAQIDTLIAEQQRLVGLLQERREVLVDTVLARGVTDSVELVPTDNPWFPELPAGWKPVRLSHELSAGPSNGVSPEVATGEGIRSLTLGAVRSGCISQSPEVTKVVSVESISNVAQYRLMPDDVLLVRGNGNPDLVGRAGIVGPEFADEEYIYPDLLIRIRLSELLDPRFFVLVCNSGVARAQFRTKSRTAVGTFKIAADDVKSLVVPMPPLPEQVRIVEVLERDLAKVDELVTNAERFIDLSRERRSALITAAVTGQIDISEAS